ncbi:MAG: PH domain-containing protein [Planctomycetota bacterium]
MKHPLPTVDRPDPRQLYLSLIMGLFLTVISCGMGILGLIPILIRYFTTRYRFDNEGVGVMWGFLFRRESYITFDKIQDIHLNRGFLERQFGLGTVDVQTASASAGAEISLFGLRDYDEIRDFLYTRMRGSDDDDDEQPQPASAAAAPAGTGEDETLALLSALKDEVVRLRERLDPPSREQVSLSPPEAP